MHRTEQITSPVLVAQHYWDDHYAQVPVGIAPPGNALRQWLEKNVPAAAPGNHALEVGCYPGRFLAVLGLKGYTVHGIDLTPRVETMESELKKLGLSTGRFIHDDFLTHSFDQTFDLVCSFGFIEHFTEWEKVVLRHAELVKPGGLLVIETPNFRGWIQQLFHRWCDAENLRRHHLPSMRPEQWAKILRAEGFDVLQCGYFGRFDFWHDSSGRGWWQRLGFLKLRILTPLLRLLPEGGAAWSPYCGIIARRK